MQLRGGGGPMWFTFYRVEDECNMPLGFVVPRLDAVIFIHSQISHLFSLFFLL